MTLTERLANKVSSFVSTPTAFTVAVSLIILWALAGPFCNFSDTWQLVINTSTTIITFLMVFLLQRSQSKDSAALHLKVSELIRAIETANNKLINIEDEEENKILSLKNEINNAARNP